jgi:hypothetical protein
MEIDTTKGRIIWLAYVLALLLIFPWLCRYGEWVLGR